MAVFLWMLMNLIIPGWPNKNGNFFGSPVTVKKHRHPAYKKLLPAIKKGMDIDILAVK